MNAVDIGNARHYRWGGDCDGWHLLDLPELSVIQERVPPGGAETLHRHALARQFFYVLQGRASFELDGVALALAPGAGLHVPPGAAHRIRNEGAEDLHFLVVSSPHSHGDRQSA